MADDATTTTETIDAQPTTEEPQGTDWKAMSRKWERQAKDNKRQLDELQRTLDGFRAESEAKAAETKTAEDTIAELKRQLAEQKAAAEREAMVREVAKAKGVDADVLLRMAADDRGAAEENADMLLQSMRRKWPDVPDNGTTKAPRMTREQILAEKNPQKQLRLIAENKDLFK